MAGSVALMNLLDVALVAFVTHGAHVFDSAGGVVGWCRVNGIARATFYRHLARVRQDGSWAPLSRRPRRSPGGTAPPNKRPRSSWRRFSYARPRDCYQIDATIITLAGGAKVVVFEVLDDATR